MVRGEKMGLAMHVEINTFRSLQSKGKTCVPKTHVPNGVGPANEASALGASNTANIAIQHREMCFLVKCFLQLLRK